MPKPSKTPSWRTYMRQSKTAKSPKVAKVLHDQALKLRREERSAKATVPAKKCRIYTPKTVKNIPNAGLDKAESWSQEGTGSVTLKAAGVAKAAQPGWTATGDQLYSDDMDVASGVDAHNVNAAFDRAVDQLIGQTDASEIHKILGALVLEKDREIRLSLEDAHVRALKHISEVNAANVVRSYMALIDGLGHANGGPVPPYIVIPGLMAVRVYDALRNAGHSPDGN